MATQIWISIGCLWAGTVSKSEERGREHYSQDPNKYKMQKEGKDR